MTIKDLYSDYTKKRTDARSKVQAQADAQKALADATSAAQQADQDASASLLGLTAKAPEGVPYLFGSVIVMNMHGEIKELPLGDADTDLDVPAPTA